jgi:hypothetical protein
MHAIRPAQARPASAHHVSYPWASAFREAVGNYCVCSHSFAARPVAVASAAAAAAHLLTAHCCSQLCLPQHLPQHLTHCIAKPLGRDFPFGWTRSERRFPHEPNREQDLSALNHLGTVLATVRLRGLYCILCTSAAYCTLHFTAPRCCWQQCRRLPNCAYSACPRTSPLINGYRQHTIADEDAMTWRLLGL